ncbi:CCAAT/enhancer-binding protein zeta [Elysia marginata]|uniref:CCAAT/enhancer-binding protein zeta n=1 Tax=Elysia marginata TaxID=1093978 RepID=A0AAV4EDZ8_9GAST|nr:CCAAT/enhancer-binding protein zeta [Elysia marginata]
MMNYQPCLNPYQMPDDQLRNELRVQGKATTGTRAELVERFLARENRCMTMSLGMAPEMACRVDQQCMGIECCLGVKLFMFRKNYRFYTRYDPCTMELVVGINDSYETRLGPNLDMDDIYGGFKDLTLETGLVEASLNAELMLKMSLEKSDTQITLTASAGFCRQNDVAGVNCLLFLPILDKAIMALPVCGPAPDRTLTFREVNLKSELRNMKDKFHENSRSTFSSLVDTVVAEAANLVPCMSTDVNSGARLPCPRPDRMTEANLQAALQARNLSTTGTKSQMVSRLEQADRECTSANGTTYTIPYESNSTFNNDVYMTISDDCRRFEACVDFTYKLHRRIYHVQNVNQELSYSIDSVVFTSRVEELRRRLQSASGTDLTQVGMASRLPAFSPSASGLAIYRLSYNLLQNLTLNEYVLDVSLKIQVDQAASPVVDTVVAPGLRLPIPTCNADAYELPTSVGTFANLADQFGGRLKDDMVAYMFKMLHLNNVLTDTCTLGNETMCPYNVSVEHLLPNDYQDRVSCITTTGCDGISCCIDWAMDLPDVRYDVIKQVPFEFNFDPCNNMYLRIRFGGYQHTENLLDYEFGSQTILGSLQIVSNRCNVLQLFD